MNECISNLQTPSRANNGKTLSSERAELWMPRVLESFSTCHHECLERALSALVNAHHLTAHVLNELVEGIVLTIEFAQLGIDPLRVNSPALLQFVAPNPFASVFRCGGVCLRQAIRIELRVEGPAQKRVLNRFHLAPRTSCRKDSLSTSAGHCCANGTVSLPTADVMLQEVLHPSRARPQACNPAFQRIRLESKHFGDTRRDQQRILQLVLKRSEVTVLVDQTLAIIVPACMKGVLELSRPA